MPTASLIARLNSDFESIGYMSRRKAEYPTEGTSTGKEQHGSEPSVLANASETHTRQDEAKLRVHLKRRLRKINKNLDRCFMAELEEIYAGKSVPFNYLQEGESFRRPWRGPLRGGLRYAVPEREVDLVVTKREGKPVITTLEIPVLDEKAAIEAKRKEIESGADPWFNDLQDGEEYEGIWEGPGRDIWHTHRIRIEKADGKPVISVVEHTIHYGTRWG